MTVNAISDTKKGRTGIAPTYLHTTRFSIGGSSILSFYLHCTTNWFLLIH